MPAKHTPGPWAQATHSPTDVVADENTIVATARDGLNGVARDQAVANAALIAAAPDLLAALQQAERMLSDWQHTLNARGARVDPLLDEARAVIARAIGPTDDQFLAALGPCGK